MEETKETPALTLDQRRELCTAKVTLDGKKAVIGGARGMVARVTILPDGPSYDYAWSTVARIVATHGGEFRS